MSNTNDLIVVSLCKYFHLLQASTQFIVKMWTVECVKSALKFANQMEDIVANLTEDETSAIQCFLQNVSTIFPHFSSSIHLTRLRNAVDVVIENLCNNPYLSQSSRDCIFEYCLDTNRKLPQFDKYSSKLHFIPESLLSVIECRLFGSHVSSLNNENQAEKFLDSCFLLDSKYTIHLLVRVLEQSIHCEETDTLTKIIISWLYIAIQKSNKAYISLASYNHECLRDLTVQIPEFGKVILKLFDETKHTQIDEERQNEEDTEDKNQIMLMKSLLIDLSKQIILVDHLNPVLLSQITRLSKKHNPAAKFWNSILNAINST
ncbi:unnamed protein product [Trichobilharzia szidati]|nr:unnamed protein product [Trichobilharzia szidati]